MLSTSMIDSSKHKQVSANNHHSNVRQAPFQVHSQFLDIVRTPRKEGRGPRADYGKLADSEKFGSIVCGSIPLEAWRDQEKGALTQSYQKPRRRELEERIEKHTKPFQTRNSKPKSLKKLRKGKDEVSSSMQKLKKSCISMDYDDRNEYYNNPIMEKGRDDEYKLTQKWKVPDHVLLNQVSAHSSQISLGVLHQSRTRRKQIPKNTVSNSSPYKDHSHVSENTELYSNKIIKIVDNSGFDDSISANQEYLEERRPRMLGSITQESTTPREATDELTRHSNPEIESKPDSNVRTRSKINTSLQLKRKPQSSNVNKHSKELKKTEQSESTSPQTMHSMNTSNHLKKSGSMQEKNICANLKEKVVDRPRKKRKHPC